LRRRGREEKLSSYDIQSRGREHANEPQHSIRDLGFSLVALQECFTFRGEWYREGGEARERALSYYFVLRTALRKRPHLRGCLTRCRHCRIFFLTHPRNRGRKDLGCPFGCREAHRKKTSAERSGAYYRTAVGKKKKAGLNDKRRQSRASREREKSPAQGEASAKELKPSIVEHIQVVTSLIEGFEVSLEQVLAMLERTRRQRRIVREGRLEYVLRWLAEHSP
jgi:hypothetical protein